MAATHVDTIDRTVQKTYAWLNEIAAALGTEDRHKAYLVLRAYLHALRDRLSVDEAAQLGAQLPVLIRGIYYDGWDPSKTPVKMRHADEFLQRVAKEAHLLSATEAKAAVRAAADVMRSRVAEDEMQDVLGMLPARVRELID